MRDDVESGDDIKDILSHSVMIQREWSRKEPISLPLVRQNQCCRMEREEISRKSSLLEREFRGVVKKGADFFGTLSAK